MHLYCVCVYSIQFSLLLDTSVSYCLVLSFLFSHTILKSSLFQQFPTLRSTEQNPILTRKDHNLFSVSNRFMSLVSHVLHG